VVGHTGLLPQTAKNFKQVGRTSEEARKVMNEAQTIQNAGAFMVVLEYIPC
jgi:3-methyl-2-oxobutanoate hydroxymethyltransferase